ncbi:hypothetical protein [Variovorax boronicumulans]|uniref:hypothetical protein n=1 Tax=Variovorax boronicumulans TaxID=436515 RepID=UPI0012E43261|nr:hypothetical protein [Variovorax boronicumulans]GER21301.1 hypothetical protein VCH24_63480 [Variovorax boronicumulans]
MPPTDSRALELTANIQVAGSTVYVLNDHYRPSNLWAARVQPGFDGNGHRLSEEDCELIAQKIAAALSTAPQSDGWILPSDSLPEPDVDVLVWSQHFWEKAPSAKIDQWSMQREAPLEFSSATIEVGFGWNEHDDFESVIAWKSITPPKMTEGQSHGE